MDKKNEFLNIFMEQKQISLVFTEYPKLYLPMIASRSFPVTRRFLYGLMLDRMSLSIKKSVV